MAERRDESSDVFAAGGWLRLELFEPAAVLGLKQAAHWAAETRWESIRSPHLFMGLLSTNDARVSEWCRSIGTDADSLLLQFTAMFRRSQEESPIVRLHREFMSENLIGVVRAARTRSQKRGSDLVGLGDLLVCLLTLAGGIVAGCFVDAGISAELLESSAVAAERSAKQAPNSR
jgi:ATP-dependent Clp protease ATP-binding subunit ClpA